jgi:DNA-directed RNA polymerase specialized sigma24 family protein
MGTASRMSERTGAGGDAGQGDRGDGDREVHEVRPVALALNEHAIVLGRVAMALLGDAVEVERVLETAAREAGARPLPEGVKPLTWLLGLVRTASATQLSKLPIRGRGERETAPEAERLDAGDAVPARAALGTLRPTEREAVILSLVGGLAAAEVAVACNVDLATAKTRLERGLAQLLEDAPAGTSDEGGAR